MKSIRNKMLVICPLVILGSIVVFNLYYNYFNTDNNISNNEETTNLYAIYIENPDSNRYVEYEFEGWPGNEYIYNQEESYCINDSIMNFNSSTSNMQLIATGADRCYVFFDLK